VLPLVDIGHSFSRKILVAFPILLIALLFPLFDSNAQIKLAWDPNPEPDVAGYQIYYGTASRNYGHSIDVGNVTAYALLGLTQGVTYYIALTAYDSSNNESAFSNEVSGRITETVSTPNVLNGPTGGNTGQPCTYTAGGSSSTLGHALQYQFDWKGDGSDLSPWGSATQTKTWIAPGTWSVRVRARCTTHTGAVSSWFGSISVTINQVTASYVVTTNPPGFQVVVDGLHYTAPQPFNWTPGSNHTLSVPSPQSGVPGTRFIFSSWNNNGSRTQTTSAPSSTTTYTANLTTQYTLTTSISPTGGGTVIPSALIWYNSGQEVSLSAKPKTNFVFVGWSGDLSTPSTPASIMLDSPKSVTANFSAITLLAPNGKDTIPSGSTYMIRWNSPSPIAKFDLFYSLDNGSTWKLIAKDVTSTSYNWQVPAVPGNKAGCRINVMGYDTSRVRLTADRSDSPFTIEVAQLTSPNGSEILSSGAVHNITWVTNVTSRPVASVKVFLTQNGGATWSLIAAVPGNPGSYGWTVPSLAKPTSKCKMKIDLRDVNGVNVGTDVSDGYFTIQP
jgi:uncharacterized repeat protein (TIGR02543 family)